MAELGKGRIMNTHLPLAIVAVALVACGAAKNPSATDAVDSEAAATPAVEAPAADASASPLDAALAAAHRAPEHRARDAFRNPKATLEFCGVTADATVVELSPGGGWYAEILAPFLAKSGSYVAAVPSAEGKRAKYRKRFTDRVEAEEEVFAGTTVATFDPPEAVDLGEPGSADVVLTFRNTHSWIRDDAEAPAYEAVFDALKPGGTFCVVQHRLPEDAELEEGARERGGYVKQSYVVDVAGKAGFELDASSEINANAKDSADHPKGVWTLPPSLALGDEDRETYAAIGESDRMTLRFKKPEQ